MGREIQCPAQMEFSVTSHGNDLVDGLRRTMKCLVWRFVKSGRSEADDCKAYYSIAVERNPNINIYYISAEIINANKNEFVAVWSNTFAIPNTHKVHCVRPRGKYQILVKEHGARAATAGPRCCCLRGSLAACKLLALTDNKPPALLNDDDPGAHGNERGQSTMNRTGASKLERGQER